MVKSRKARAGVESLKNTPAMQVVGARKEQGEGRTNRVLSHWEKLSG